MSKWHPYKSLQPGYIYRYCIYKSWPLIMRSNVPKDIMVWECSASLLASALASHAQNSTRTTFFHFKYYFQIFWHCKQIKNVHLCWARREWVQIIGLYFGTVLEFTSSIQGWKHFLNIWNVAWRSNSLKCQLHCVRHKSDWISEILYLLWDKPFIAHECFTGIIINVKWEQIYYKGLRK